MHRVLTVGVLALQGAFFEHLRLLERAAAELRGTFDNEWLFTEVRSPSELATCDALVIPGGESTTMALVASRSGLLDPLREFVKVQRKPTWGTCAGLILLAEAANRTKKGGQDLIGGLDVKVDRNHFGRQNESFETDMDLTFLSDADGHTGPFRGIFIRAPIVERVVSQAEDKKALDALEETVLAPEVSSNASSSRPPVEILGKLSKTRNVEDLRLQRTASLEEEIVAVRQGHVFGTSFHPELTQDARIHVWWLRQVSDFLQHT